jgi:hypothetical protein
MIRLTRSFASAIVDSIGAARRQVVEGSHSMGKLRARRLLPFRFRRMTPINLLHALLSPPDRIGDGAHSCRNPLSAVVLCQLSGRKNACGDQ